MAHSCIELYIHIIFSTKDRKQIIPQSHESSLHGYIQGILKKRNIPVIRINGMHDHIHILLKLNSVVPLGTLIKEIKSYSTAWMSTAWMKKERFLQFAWQIGYGAFSCSINHVDALTNYIDNQKEHHKKFNFSEEVMRLCQKWQVKWTYEEQTNETNSENNEIS
ncbi:Transposase [Candidatus Rubidus massiliensis]|nr:Transposase [Candidatus Rubidus massiliensis]